MSHRFLALVFALLSLACGSTEKAAPAAAGVPEVGYVFVFLVSGPHELGLTPRQRDEARTGHLESTRKMARQGLLLAAGPLTEPLADPRHRDAWLLDVRTVEEALELGSEDAAVRLKAFDLSAFPFESPSPVRRLPELEQQASGMRSYVLATAPTGSGYTKMIELLDAQGIALFHGTLGGDRDGTGLVALDARSVDEAQAILSSFNRTAGTRVAFETMPWAASSAVALLAKKPQPVPAPAAPAPAPATAPQDS